MLYIPLRILGRSSGTDRIRSSLQRANQQSRKQPVHRARTRDRTRAGEAVWCSDSVPLAVTLAGGCLSPLRRVQSQKRKRNTNTKRNKQRTKRRTIRHHGPQRCPSSLLCFCCLRPRHTFAGRFARHILSRCPCGQWRRARGLSHHRFVLATFALLISVISS